MREALGFRGSGFRVVSFRLQGARNGSDYSEVSGVGLREIREN